MPANEVHAMRRNPSQPQSWEETFREMAREREVWSDLDAALADGLDPDTVFELSPLTTRLPGKY
ncbi:MAG TPA: hypothetical protein VI545_03600 [Burkholderiales bacterium]|nr:hypothetical protein [Burkholderiales bacterium]